MSEHTRYECPPTCSDCNEGICKFRDGGLFNCTVCDGFEGTLPTDCPGRKLTTVEADAIYAERLDYVRGRWWEARQ